MKKYLAHQSYIPYSVDFRKSCDRDLGTKDLKDKYSTNIVTNIVQI